MSTPAGWYDDGQGRQRWWDGAQWTEHFAPVQTPAPQQQPPAAPPASKNIWGLLSLIAGIVGIVLAWVVFGGLVGIAGLVFGFLGLAAVKKRTATNKGMSITGIVLSAVAMLVSIVFLVVYIGVGAWFASDAKTAGETSAPATSAAPGDEPSPTPTASSNVVPIADDLTVEVTVQAKTLDPPEAVGGEEPDKKDYARAWGPAVDTDGEIAEVTATFRNTGTTADTSVGTFSLFDRGDPKLADYENLWPTVAGYDLNIIRYGDIPAGGEKTYTLGYAVPASEIDQVAGKLVVSDMKVGHEFDVLTPNPGQGCEEISQGKIEGVEVWSCLQVVE